jgi:hypothetical protein
MGGDQPPVVLGLGDLHMQHGSQTRRHSGPGFGGTFDDVDIGMQTTTHGNPEPTHRLRGARPDDLPISAAVWDAADLYGKRSDAVIQALYDAVKQLETESIEPRP